MDGRDVTKPKLKINKHVQCTSMLKVKGARGGLLVIQDDFMLKKVKLGVLVDFHGVLVHFKGGLG